MVYVLAKKVSKAPKIAAVISLMICPSMVFLTFNGFVDIGGLLGCLVCFNLYFVKDKVDALVLSDKVLEERLRSRTLDRNLLPLIAASRGRYVDNPKLRQVGLPTKQHLEINFKGLSNTLTSVQKDNYVVEHVDDYVGVDANPFSKKIEYTSFKNRDTVGYLLASDYKSPKAVAFQLSDQLRIRKLLPLECWRLMGFTDEDFTKAESVVSNTQLYKQAGNSVTVTVIEAIAREFRKIEEEEEHEIIT